MNLVALEELLLNLHEFGMNSRRSRHLVYLGRDVRGVVCISTILAVLVDRSRVLAASLKLGNGLGTEHGVVFNKVI